MMLPEGVHLNNNENEHEQNLPDPCPVWGDPMENLENNNTNKRSGSKELTGQSTWPKALRLPAS